MQNIANISGFVRGALKIAGILLLLLVAAIASCRAQPPRALRSPEVSADHRVTFRFHAPNDKARLLAREGAPLELMQKDDQGVWSLTNDPLEPDIYSSAFVAYGVSLIDPGNSLITPNL